MWSGTTIITGPRGKITLAVGDRVRLMCAHSYLLVPIEVTHWPGNDGGMRGGQLSYHRSVAATRT
ncbi:MAG TPA: hypothetical protein VL024_01700 [Castellaniella sp.]|nr:hypothetical protein [Castellaniella sp.]